MARAFAAALGRHHVRVNSLHPGAVNTPMGSGGMATSLMTCAETNPRLMNMITPFLLEGIAQTEDIADAVCGLASDQSKFVTASAISVDLGSAHFSASLRTSSSTTGSTITTHSPPDRRSADR
jgi:NAD(P)-dependent dehydrogenase (short-subunit alcohol dehydrogenase family)